jgi:glycosyltransferase involved in cell wall biosynthesis
MSSVGINLLWLGEAAAGVGRYALELIAALPEADPDARMVGFLGRGAPAGVEESAHIEWRRLPVQTGGRIQLAAQMTSLPVLARRLGLDLLHSPSGVGPAIAPGLATVVTLHDLLWLHQGERWEARRARRAAGVLQSHSARRATRVIAVSSATRDDVVATLGVDPARVDVVLEGTRIPDAQDAMPEAELRRRHDLGEAPVVLCVAQKRPYKNLASLIRALPRVPDALLVLPGTPTPHEQELRTLAAELGVGDRVRFPGWVSEPELDGLYRLARCFVLPSLLEGFGLPVLEAMARDLPVACSNRGSLPEVAGDAALLFDPEDQAGLEAAISRLLGDPDLAADLRRRGRERARQLTWRRTAEGTLASYRRALAPDD